MPGLPSVAAQKQFFQRRSGHKFVHNKPIDSLRINGVIGE